MPTPGLSLVGFMANQQQAINHLRLQCVSANPLDAPLISEWHSATANLGQKFPRAGRPDITPIPASGAPYMDALLQKEWVIEALRIHGLSQAEFKMIEIDPLLAFQITIDGARSDQHCSGLVAPKIEDLLPICLPDIQPTPFDTPYFSVQQPNSFTLKTKSLNVKPMQAGAFSMDQNGYKTIVLGMQIHVPLPFVHVVRFNGRCYLHNGYHRALGTRRTGATYIPALFREVYTEGQAGIAADGSTFPLALLESDNPPTLGHFTQGRAHDVQLRPVSRTIQVNWTETVIGDEYHPVP